MTPVIRVTPSRQSSRDGMAADGGVGPASGVRQQVGRLAVWFFDNTTIHGVGHLRAGAGCGWRLVWTVLVLLAAVMLTMCVITITRQTLVHRVSTSTVRQQTPDSLPIPAVTVCAGHFFSQPHAQTLNVSAAMAAYVSTTASGFMASDDPPDGTRLQLQQPEAELRQLLRRSGLTLLQLFDQLSPSCEETVSGCWLGQWQLLSGAECCRRLLRAVYTPLGRCWTTLGTDIRQSMAGVRFGLRLDLRPLNAPADMDFSALHMEPPSQQLRVVATNHYTPPAFATVNRAVAAAVGQAVSLEVWKEEHDISAERTPLLGGAPDCQPVPLAAGPLPAPVAGAAGCLVHALRQQYLELCGCRHLGMDVLDRGAGWTEEPLCTPQQTLSCAADRMQQLLVNASRVSVACRPACVSDSVRVTATYEQRPAEDANTTAVTVFYSDVVFTSVTAVVPGIMDWCQGVGGVAGLFFGMSALSLWELVLVAAAMAGQLLRLLTRTVWKQSEDSQKQQQEHPQRHQQHQLKLYY